MRKWDRTADYHRTIEKFYRDGTFVRGKTTVAQVRKAIPILKNFCPSTVGRWVKIILSDIDKNGTSVERKLPGGATDRKPSTADLSDGNDASGAPDRLNAGNSRIVGQPRSYCFPHVLFCWKDVDIANKRNPVLRNCLTLLVQLPGAALVGCQVVENRLTIVLEFPDVGLSAAFLEGLERNPHQLMAYDAALQVQNKSAPAGIGETNALRGAMTIDLPFGAVLRPIVERRMPMGYKVVRCGETSGGFNYALVVEMMELGQTSVRSSRVIPLEDFEQVSLPRVHQSATVGGMKLGFKTTEAFSDLSSQRPVNSVLFPASRRESSSNTAETGDGTGHVTGLSNTAGAFIPVAKVEVVDLLDDEDSCSSGVIARSSDSKKRLAGVPLQKSAKKRKIRTQKTSPATKTNFREPMMEGVGSVVSRKDCGQSATVGGMKLGFKTTEAFSDLSSQRPVNSVLFPATKRESSSNTAETGDGTGHVTGLSNTAGAFIPVAKVEVVDLLDDEDSCSSGVIARSSDSKKRLAGVPLQKSAKKRKIRTQKTSPATKTNFREPMMEGVGSVVSRKDCGHVSASSASMLPKEPATPSKKGHGLMPPFLLCAAHDVTIRDVQCERFSEHVAHYQQGLNSYLKGVPCIVCNKPPTKQTSPTVYRCKQCEHDWRTRNVRHHTPALYCQDCFKQTYQKLSAGEPVVREASRREKKPRSLMDM